MKVAGQKSKRTFGASRSRCRSTHGTTTTWPRIVPQDLWFANTQSRRFVLQPPTRSPGCLGRCRRPPSRRARLLHATTSTRVAKLDDTSAARFDCLHRPERWTTGGPPMSKALRHRQPFSVKSYPANLPLRRAAVGYSEPVPPPDVAGPGGRTSLAALDPIVSNNSIDAVEQSRLNERFAAEWTRRGLAGALIRLERSAHKLLPDGRLGPRSLAAKTFSTIQALSRAT